MKRYALVALVVAFLVLQQDFWWWKDPAPLVFGFLPIGLAYHAGYSIGAALLMALLVKLVWPRHLEELEPEKTPQASGEPRP